MKVKSLCLMAMCLAILVICSKISVNIGVIALTFQTFAVAIISFLLKWKKASIVFLAFIIMGLVGIPVFSGGGGFDYVLKPSFGFIIGFFFASFVNGSTLFDNHKWSIFVKGLLGLIVIDVIGLIYMYVILKFYLESENATFMYVCEAGLFPFLLKDSVSVVIAGMIAIRLKPVLDNMGTYNKNIVLESTEDKKNVKQI